MKLIASIALFSVAECYSVRVARDDSDVEKSTEDKRYFQLVKMMRHHNSDFDERKYWAYGCNCLILGDRPMSDPGHGPPIDPLDTVCKQYKDCLKCARLAHGDMCIGEFVKYKFSIKNNGPVCRDEENSCGRALCECDAQFAANHVGQKHHFKEQYHMFWSTNNGGPMWDPKNDPNACPRGPGGPTTPECCGGDGVPFQLFNSDRKFCCSDKRVVNDANDC